ncbi:MAG: hypothetical protein GX066_05670, partial [Clostridiaceae bacterium]|nr:hypothetical protein [Clostridiaceae bacterium]
PGLEDEMTAPYCNEEALAYRNTRRTRMNGLNEDGVAFINTGRGADLGAAVLALNTTGMKNVKVSWTGGTVLPNSRIYAIILQYRVGKTGPFINVMQDGKPVEYVRNETEGHSQRFSDILLPEEVNDKPHVELRWKYYIKEQGSGARAQLRLDDIFVTAEKDEGDEPDYIVNTSFNLEKLQADKMLTASVNVTNIKGAYPSVMVIVALFDADNRMVNVSYIAKEIKIGSTEELSAGFKLPEDVEGYEARVFVWDGENLTDTQMQPLSNVSIIK